jgi:hypothetical protein
MRVIFTINKRWNFSPTPALGLDVPALLHIFDFRCIFADNKLVPFYVFAL